MVAVVVVAVAVAVAVSNRMSSDLLTAMVSPDETLACRR